MIVGCMILGFGVYIEVVADVVSFRVSPLYVPLYRPGILTLERLRLYSIHPWRSLQVFSPLLSGESLMESVRVRSLRHCLLDLSPDYSENISVLSKNIFSRKSRMQNNPRQQIQKIYKNKNVIVIGRQYGSGGHDIGKMLADKINKACFRRVALANW